MSNPAAEPLVIHLPTDKQSQDFLIGKLAEYKGRLDHTKHPENPLQGWDNICKIAVLSRLLKTGSVNCWDLSVEIAQKYAQFIANQFEAFERAFNNACSVIIDYCETGGVNVQH